MAQYRRQKNITVTNYQKKILKDNFGILEYAEIARKAGTTLNKVVNNLKVMGLIKQKPQAPVIKMKNNFDLDEFKKYYNY